MVRATYYDALARCYKIRPDVPINQVQRLGRLETLEDKIWIILTGYKNGMQNAESALKDITDAIKEGTDEGSY